MTDGARRPVLVAFDDDSNGRTAVARELRKRYGEDYEVIAADVGSAPAAIDELSASGRTVAVVLSNDVDVLDASRTRFPDALRALLLTWGDPRFQRSIIDAMSTGIIDRWIGRPWREPDEGFHASVSELLLKWESEARPPFEMVSVIGPHLSARVYELRDILNRNAIPHRFYDAEADDGRRLLADEGLDPSALPVVKTMGRTLVRPTNTEVADAIGVRVAPSGGTYDVVVVGSGPAGLAAGVYGQSEGLRTALLEREALGGQAGTTSMIRNYLGFSRGISGAELMQRAFEQAWLFGAEFIYGGEATGLRVEGDDRIVVLSSGTQIRTKAVVVANGVSYRRLGIPNVERLVGVGVFYGAAITDPASVVGKRAFIVGGGNSAGQAALFVQRHGAEVTLLVRGTSLAEGMSDYLIKELDRAGIDIRYEVEVVDASGTSRLEGVTLLDRRTGDTVAERADGLVVLIGAEPRTEWLPPQIERDDWGYLLTGVDISAEAWSLDRPPALLETSLPGVFAAGDVRHGSVKRVAAAAGDGSIAIRFVHEYLTRLRAAR
jgi:thioredoxin reductase (NADPH)